MAIRGRKAGKNSIRNIIKNEEQVMDTINPEEIVFALDIGTRSVVGIIGIQEKNNFKIIDIEVMNHSSRSMMDGQIHEISKVAEVVEIVKEKLESRLGFQLRRASIAAAGRALKTVNIKVEKNIDAKMVITSESIEGLELEGVQLAHAKLRDDNSDDVSNYYCIGHTIINYYLDGYVMTDLLGHKGRYIGADILATFLPQTVVDSLYAVMEKVGLKVASLTLEPIAAINVSIPKDIRLLNIALIDIGAGTSDIAITKDGAITAYAMCAVAGDEITEAIAKNYLLDFNTAEKIKLQLLSKDIIEIKDIMGIKTKVKSSEILNIIEPSVKRLAEEIGEKILECNGKAPNAVFCVGGGSQTPGLVSMLTKKLDMTSERVGIRGTDIIKNIKFAHKKLLGPEAVTPIGIAITSIQRKGSDFVQVKLNKNKIDLYNTGKLLVADAVGASGFTAEQLLARRGTQLNFTLNGKKHTIKGEIGTASQIYVNAIEASLDTKISNGDNIRIVPAECGKPAKAFVGDFVSNPANTDTKKIVFNDNEIDITTKILLNGKTTSLRQEISEGDKLEIQEILSISDLAKVCEVDMNDFDMVVNSKVSDKDYVIKNGDIIKSKYRKQQEARDSEQINVIPLEGFSRNIKNVRDDVNIQHLPVAAGSIKNKSGMDMPTKDEITVFVNNQPMKLEGKSKYIFVDIFNNFNFDNANKSSRIDIKLNGIPARYTDGIKEGDTIEIEWL